MATGPGPRYLSERHVSSISDLVWHPAEKPIFFQSRGLGRAAISGSHGPALGVEFSWIVWLLIISMVTALVLKRRFRVTF